MGASIQPALKAIPTRYNGYRFRSRLEARWAVFFDRLDIEYTYEVEGFETVEGWYLPDFYLPRLEYWFEVKGSLPDAQSAQKMEAFARGINAGFDASFFLAYGEVGRNSIIEYFSEPEDDEVLTTEGISYRITWEECLACNKVMIDDVRCCGRGGDRRETPRILAAYAAARSFRF
jgi:hypothetical protein